MRIFNFLVSFLFGLAGILSFAPFSIKIFIFISYAYLIYLIISNNKDAFLRLFFWGIGHWGFGMSWIIVSVYYYGETTIAMSLTIFLLLIIILSLVFTCPIYIICKLLNLAKISSNFNKSLFISAMLMLIEFSRYYFLNGVPWLIPGNIFLDTITQNIYSILGVSATSLLVYLLCCNLVLNKQNNFFYIIICLMIISILPDNKTHKINDGIKIAVIQPSSDPFLKYKQDYYYEIEQNILNLINNVSKDAELIVIPEAELPYPIQNERFNIFIDNLPNSEKIVMGVWNIEENKLFNSIYSINNGDLYKKAHLVPFGEYIPFIDSLRGLITFFDLPMSNVTHGSRNQKNIRVLDDIEIASPICFDIAFPETVRKMNKSSLLMINISNDTWFGSSIGPYQHLEIARIRSIENNRWTIRATNDGYSAIISNKGTIVSYIEKGVSSILEGEVKLINLVSFYNKAGYLFAYIFTFFIIALYLISLIWKKYKQS
tara:strand:+ start:3829 stop:5289 length:1461 start_codon:yes stop_codon:yes gene_type:complete